MFFVYIKTNNEVGKVSDCEWRYQYGKFAELTLVVLRNIIMKSFLSAILPILTLLLSASLFNTVNASSDPESRFTEEQIRSGKLYMKSENQMQDVDHLLVNAKQQGKLAIIAMGANWCHDSQSFATKIHHPEVKAVIEENFELLFVDVGYLTNIKQVITRFGQPVIYATPTILVIDPTTNVQVNKNNMHLWRDSAKVSVDEMTEYFSNIVANKQTLLETIARQQAENVGSLAKLNQQIDLFQQQQADRLYKAFTVLGPMLEKDEQGKSVKNFRKYWKKVAKYRYKFTEDLKKLREEAVTIAQSDNSQVSMEFPEYPTFEWEK